MSELISGKEALIHAINGNIVQYNLGGMEWMDLTDRELNYWQGERFLKEELNYKFRLKPRTITINGIEVPAPFKPRDGDKYWVLDTGNENSYTYITSFENDREDKNLIKLGAWRTEEEIKQVVAALYEVFK